MRRSIGAQIIVESGYIPLASLNEAVCDYLNSKGFKTALPHVYPEDSLVIEITETLKNPNEL